MKNRLVLAVVCVLVCVLQVDCTGFARLSPYEQFRCMLLDDTPNNQQHKNVLGHYGFNAIPPMCHMDIGAYVFEALVSSRQRVTSPRTATAPDVGPHAWAKTLPGWLNFKLATDNENSQLSLVDFLSGVSLEQHSAFFAISVCGLDNYFLGTRRNHNRNRYNPPKHPGYTPPSVRKQAFAEWLHMESLRRANAVRIEMQHVWYSFTPFYAAPEVNPRTGFGHKDKWGGAPMMLCDCLSGLAVLGMEGEVQRAVQWLDEYGIQGDAQGHGITSTFEFNIRVVGGLMSAYYLTEGRYPSLLTHAESVAQKMLLTSATPKNNYSNIIFPRFSIQGIRLGVPATYQTNLAECGTLQLEFHALSQATRKPSYYRRIKKNMADVYRAIGSRGIPPLGLDVRNEMSDVILRRERSIGAGADSYYEYLLKEWIVTGKNDTLPMEKFRNFISDLPEVSVCTGTAVDCGHSYGPNCDQGEAYTGLQFEAQAPFPWNNTGGTRSICAAGAMADNHVHYEHLSCFFPGLIALLLMQNTEPLPFPEMRQKRFRQTIFDYGVRMLDACLAATFSNASGVGFETAVLSTEQMLVRDATYNLRPEIVESLFYMWRLTKEEKYRNYSWRIFIAIRKYLKVEFGYAAAENANKVPPVSTNTTETFVFSETFKYLWYTFNDDDCLDLNKWVLNTEAHALPIPSRNDIVADLLSRASPSVAPPSGVLP